MRAVFKLPELDDEQTAPFSPPDEATVKHARLELERIKARNLEATPIPPNPTSEGNEL